MLNANLKSWKKAREESLLKQEGEMKILDVFNLNFSFYRNIQYRPVRYSWISGRIKLIVKKTGYLVNPLF